MSSFKRSTVAVLSSVGLLVVGVFGSAQAASATVPSSRVEYAAAHVSATTSTGIGSPIKVPMVAVAHKSTTGGIQPNIVIPGNCGTAFLYPSNGGGHVHYDFGYEYLNNATVWVTAHVGAQNVDNGRAAANSFNGASFGRTWEKQGNLYTGTGENVISASITAYGPLYDCVSSPGLTEDVYVY
jgi:hypothetical protein